MLMAIKATKDMPSAALFRPVDSLAVVLLAGALLGATVRDSMRLSQQSRHMGWVAVA